ncbi:MAG: PAS domain S-box protein, partial [Acidimicrobiia bacterium]|nr:PAS domain S-box protein [Acidimicrobiia bacterium]
MSPTSKEVVTNAGVTFDPVEAAVPMLAATVDAVLVVDEGGTVVFANEGAARLFASDDMVGQPVERFVPARFRERHAAHREGYQRDPTPRLMGERAVDLQAQRADGSTLPVEISLSPIQVDGQCYVMASMRDLTDRLATQAMARRIAGTLDAVHDGVFMFDPDNLVFSWVNDGAVSQTGYSRHELLDGMTPLDIKPRFTETEFRQLVAPLLDGTERRVAFETVHRRRDGSEVPVDIVLERPADVLVAVARDVTVRHQAELERDRREALLDALSRVRLALIDQRPINQVLEEVCLRAQQLTDAELAVIAVPSTSELIDVGAVPEGDPLVGLSRRVPLQDTLAGAAIHQQAVQRAGVLAREAAAWDGLADRVSAMGDAVAAPIVHQNRVEGVLVVARTAGAEPLSGDDVRSVVLLAAEAGIAIDLSRGRSDQDRLALVEDRSRIARDLHDLVIQRLFAAGMRLQSALGVPELLAERSQDTIAELDETIAVIRQSIFQLVQPTDDLGVAVQRLADQHGDRTGTQPRCSIEGDVEGLSPARREAVLATITEALANIARHAHAGEVTIDVDVADDLVLTIDDDGSGFDAGAGHGFGLRNM